MPPVWIQVGSPRLQGRGTADNLPEVQVPLLEQGTEGHETGCPRQEAKSEMSEEEIARANPFDES